MENEQKNEQELTEEQQMKKNRRENNRKEREREQQEQKEVEQLVNLLCKVANHGNNKQLFEQTLQHEHRTHQQTITNLLLKWFVCLAQMKQNNACDLRNQASVDIGWDIVNKVLSPQFRCESGEEFLKRFGNSHRLLQKR